MVCANSLVFGKSCARLDCVDTASVHNVAASFYAKVGLQKLFEYRNRVEHVFV